MSNDSKFKQWLKERLPLSNFNYKVPRHGNTLLFSLGGITLLCVIILIITGSLLAFYYDPNPDAANQSIRILMTQTTIGALVRGIHVWAARIVTVTLILHLLRVLFYGSYKKPREIHWIFGVVLFVLMMGLLFTGTALKWDQEASEAISHAVAIGKLMGPLGVFFTFAPNVAILTKFFILHVSILPLLLFVILIIHLFLVKALKISPLPYHSKHEGEGEEEKVNHTFAQHSIKLVGYAFILFGVLIGLSLLLPPTLGPIPTAGVETTKPPWVFMGIFSIENWVGLSGLAWGAVLIVVLLLIVPFVDRGKSQLFKDRKVFLTLASVIVIFLGYLTINAYVSKPKQHLGMAMGENQVQLDNAVVSKTLDSMIDLAGKENTAITNKNKAVATQDATKLNQTLETLKPFIAAKDAQVADQIKIAELTALFKSDNPDYSKAASIVTTMKTGLNQAKTLFPVGTLQVIDDSMEIVAKAQTAVNNKDQVTAAKLGETLDGMLDPIKETLKDQDASIVDQLDTDGFANVLKDSNPDWSKASSILNTMKQALVKAKGIVIKDQLDHELTIVQDINTAIANKDAKAAIVKATELDETLDPLKDLIKDKNASLVDQLNTDGLANVLKDSNPNWSKASRITSTMQKAINEAKKLF